MNDEFEYDYTKYRVLEIIGEGKEFPITGGGIDGKKVATELNVMQSMGFEYLALKDNKVVPTEKGKRFFEFMKKSLEKLEEKNKPILEAEEIIKDPNFVDIVIKELDKTIVGEIETRKVILSCMNGRLVENAKLTSYNLIVNDETGAGKDWLVSQIGKLLPEEQYIKRTRISEKVFTYWHNPKFEPDWTWNGKVFYNEDISQNVLNSDVFKVMASTGSNATIIINQIPIDIPIKGKPIMIATTESATPNRENVRRFAIVDLDTTVNQTSAIMERQAELSKIGKTTEYNSAIIKALALHKRVKVKIPFADLIVKHFPKENVLMRTQFERFLDWIKSSTAFYQFQREEDEEGYFMAIGQDYNFARECFLKITSNPYMIPLTKQLKNILKSFDALGDGWYNINDLVIANPSISESWLRKQLDKLVEYKILEKDKERLESSDIERKSDKMVLIYHKKDIETLTLPTFEELQEKEKSNNEKDGKIV